MRDWYSTLFARLRWGSALSDVAMVSYGVRQGGLISPVLFNVLINVVIYRLRSLQIGCHVNGLFVGCLFYADDVMLLCPSVSGVAIADMLFLKFNPFKSQYLAMGKFASFSLPPMLLDSHPIPWVTSVKYLGVYIFSGRKFSFDITSVKQTFFAACNPYLCSG